MPPPRVTRVVWSDEALRDLEEIHDFIARNSPRYAALTAGRLIAAIDRVREFPESGRPAVPASRPVSDAQATSVQRHNERCI